VGSSTGPRVTQAQIAASVRGAHASLRQIDGHAELAVSGMPQPALGRIYEVWLNRAGGPQPTNALFGVTSNGNGSVSVPDALQGVKEVLVTSEPRGGSSRPTSAPLIRVVL
jgi:Anti-sigma-K factor rskA